MTANEVSSFRSRWHLLAPTTPGHHSKE
jgi:hypothetical protein